jgi:LysM repeat protein
MPHRGIARIAATLALAAAFIAVIVIVGQNGGSGSKSHSPKSPAARSGGPGSRRVARPTPHRSRAASHTYVVQANDTLSTIAAKTHISLATLQELNPNVDPQGLHAGQRLKLK